MAEQYHLIAIVEGRVQGVFFRAFVQEQAQNLGLKGFVRNMSDFTRVEIQAEGDRKKLETLLERVKVGPPGAKVERVETTWSSYQGIFKNFDIRY